MILAATRPAGPETVYQREMRKAAEHFASFTTEHRMTVLLDLAPEQPYRHVRFAQPGTSIYSWSLVTWPGHLSITGDLESYTFRRLYDMFDFFTGSVNPSYWGEKLVAGTAETNYSDEQFVETVNEHISWFEGDLDPDDYARLKQHAADELTSDPPHHYEEAYERLVEFDFDGRTWFSDVYEFHLGGYDYHFLIALNAIRYGIQQYRRAFPDHIVREA